MWGFVAENPSIQLRFGQERGDRYVTRSDLRNEFLMADEAFALSPIAARPVMPGDADYDAIRDAFMETSRGRWFLSEFAKRNRNADTAMVLDAVARIERDLATQKQSNAHKFAESLVAIRAIVGEARASVGKAVAGLEDETTLSAGFAGTRNIREVATTLRDCGADVRICDLLDSQIAAVESAYRLIIAIDPDEIVASFDVMLERIDDLASAGPADGAAPSNGGSTAQQSQPAAADVAAAQAEPAATTPAPAVTAEAETAAAEHPAAPGLVIVPAMLGDEVEFVEPQTAADAAMDAAAPDVVQEIADTAPAAASIEAISTDQPAPPEAAMPAANAVAEHPIDEVVARDAETAEDDAILDLVAREMSALDFSNDIEDESLVDPLGSERAEPAVDESTIDQPVAGEPAMTAVADAPSIVIAAADELADAVLTQALGDVAKDAPPSAPDSLGAALLASGAVSHPTAMQSGVLTPIRRMTQAEKIAFFS
jgi:hypothetical protein